MKKKNETRIIYLLAKRFGFSISFRSIAKDLVEKYHDECSCKNINSIVVNLKDGIVNAKLTFK